MLQSRRRRPGPMRSHAILSLRPRGSRTLVAIQKSIQAKADTGARGLRSRSSGFNARGSTPSVVGRFLQKTATSQYDTTHGRMCDGVGGCARRRFADPASQNVDGADETGRKRALASRPIEPADEPTRSVPNHPVGRRNRTETGPTASQSVGAADESGRKQVVLRVGISTAPTKRDARVSSASR